ncbi:MAG: hypothetical protein HQL63_02655 [Magnetococcales bacterium]|nr:hypothetical protein [Magnetococcales bacterium]
MNFPAINSAASSGAAKAATGSSSLLKFAVQSHLIKGLGMGAGMSLGVGVWVLGIAGMGYWLYRKYVRLY